MILARTFSLFAGDHHDKVAMLVNASSAISSGLTIMFLYWTIVHLAQKLTLNREQMIDRGHIGQETPIELRDRIVIFGSGIVGALAYTFSDSFWFSAVEGEVYASSSLFTAVVFWAVLKWENEADELFANRWLILIAYLMGLSIGVHLLNLLAIPAIVMVYYFRKYKVTASGVVWTLSVSMLLLASIMYIIIPGVIWLASRFELIFVNGFGLPYNSGVLVYCILLIALLCYGIWRTYTRKHTALNMALLGITVILIGYSCYAMIVIRSSANPPMDENNPDNVFSLQYYLNREQYGSPPVIFIYKNGYESVRAIAWNRITRSIDVLVEGGIW
jgi:hypothetical protein